MMAVLQNRQLKGDAKWYRYYRIVEGYIYQRDPRFKPFQFEFDVQEDSTGKLSFVLKTKPKKRSLVIRLLKYVPSVAGPMLGAALAAILKG